MKKIAILSLAFAFVFTLSAAPVAHADTCTTDVNQVTNSLPLCPVGNGPIQAQIAGGRFLKAGDEDCPAWYPSMFGHACYTMRAFGAYFIPLN